jgi:hypothetical protein
VLCIIIKDKVKDIILFLLLLMLYLYFTTTRKRRCGCEKLVRSKCRKRNCAADAIEYSATIRDHPGIAAGKRRMFLCRRLA